MKANYLLRLKVSDKINLPESTKGLDKNILIEQECAFTIKKKSDLETTLFAIEVLRLSETWLNKFVKVEVKFLGFGPNEKIKRFYGRKYIVTTSTLLGNIIRAGTFFLKEVVSLPFGITKSEYTSRLNTSRNIIKKLEQKYIISSRWDNHTNRVSYLVENRKQLNIIIKNLEKETK